LLLDEPTAHVDKETVEKIQEILKLINKKYNTTIIISSHDRDFLSQISDKIIYLKNGSIIEKSEPNGNQ
jgi:ABC-type multidrug transport system ATPase subunit